jgi:hypothetical protein
VVIRRSAASETRQLIAELAAEGDVAEVRRETAIARLRVIGARALRHIVPLLDPARSPETRVSALRALEGSREAAVVAPVLDTLEEPLEEVKVAALGVTRSLLDGPRGPEVLDRVTALALDAAQPLAVRRAAVAALADLPPRTLRPLLGRLKADANPAVRALVENQHLAPPTDPVCILSEAAEGKLPAEPDYVLSLVAEAGVRAPLPTLHRLVGVIRAREQAETRRARQRDWLTVRGTVHEVLASRDSRVAAYDLREAFESGEGPLPSAFVRAAATIGDAAILEAIAGAFVRAAGPHHADWRAPLADAARAIVARERLTRRHAVVKRLRARWGETVEQFLP